MRSLADRANVEAFLSAHGPVRVPSLFAAGDRIGAWRVTAFVGRGANGEVYRVEHGELGFPAALKVLTRDDAASRDRFRREAKLLAEYAHPSFPRFLAYDASGERPVLVTEFLDPFPLPRDDRGVAAYLAQVGEGVMYLHGLGFVHRDIKPGNVMRRGTAGRPVIIDLGLVKDTSLAAVHPGDSLSIVDGRGVGVGTPGYAAPEQFSGGTISPAVDVHALGMLANECFGGCPPPAWRRILRRATCSIPEQRYATVAAFLRAVRLRHVLRQAIGWGVAAAFAVMVGVLLVRGRDRVDNVTPMRSTPLRGRTLTVPETQEVAVVRRAVPVVREGASNRVVMVTGDDDDEKAIGERYPKSGVFIGDSEIDLSF